MVALLEGASLIQQFQPDPQARQARQLEELAFSLKQYPGVLSYVETLVKTGEATDTALSQILETTPRFVLTGVSGGGKTTALCKTALEITQEALEGIDQQRKTSPIPFVVYFSQWRGKQSLEDFLQEQWPYEGTAIEAIAKTNIWFFGDGLDELPKDALAKIEEINRWLSGGAGPYRAFFTCRIPHYHDGLQLALPNFEIPEELSNDQIKLFATQYLGEPTSSDFLVDIYTTPEQWAHEDIFDTFMKTPLFLTTLLQNYSKEPNNHFIQSPGGRIDLYVREVWYHEQERRNTKSFSFSFMAGACAYLASEANIPKLRNHLRGTEESFTKEFAVKELAHGLLRATQMRRNKRLQKALSFVTYPFILIWLTLQFVSQFIFAIRLFLYYKFIQKDPDASFKTATKDLTDGSLWHTLRSFWKELGENTYIIPFGPEFWITRRRASRLLKELVNSRILRVNTGGFDFSHELLFTYFLAHDDLIQGIGNKPSLIRSHNWSRAEYRDDVRTLLLASLSSDKNSFVSQISEHDPYIAAKCVENGIKVDSSVREKIIDNLLKQLKKVDLDWLAVHTVTALKSLTNPAVVSEMLDVVASNSFPPLKEAIIDAVVSLKKDAVPSLINNLLNCDSKATSVIIRSLGRISDPRAIQPLEQWIQNNQENYNYLWALAALSHMGHKPSKQIYFDQHLRYPPKRESHFDISSHCQAWTAFCQTAPNHSVAFQELLDIILSTVTIPDADNSFIQNCFYRTLKFGHFLDDSINSDLLEVYKRTEDIEIRRIFIAILTARKVVQAGETLAKDIYDPNLASDIIDAVGKLNINTPAVIKALMGYLDHPEVYIRHAAIRALGEMEILDAALPISKMLTDTEKVGRGTQTTAELAAETLLKLNTPVAKDKAADYYIARFQKANYDSAEWHSAEIKLGQIGTQKAYAAIEKERNRRHSKETDT